jgi:hypothetical protein
VAARPSTFNGAREWILEWKGEMVGRGGGRTVAPFNFSMGEELIRRLGDRASGDRRMAVLASCFSLRLKTMESIFCVPCFHEGRRLLSGVKVGRLAGLLGRHLLGGKYGEKVPGCWLH